VPPHGVHNPPPHSMIFSYAKEFCPSLFAALAWSDVLRATAMAIAVRLPLCTSLCCTSLCLHQT
jgi:hypothetical protein